MLNHKSASLQGHGATGKSPLLAASNQLYRSSSTSQLNSSSYIKGDDPSDGVTFADKAKAISVRSGTAPVKSSSCDDIAKAGGDATKKGFPYAFLRSKLSVLPEENGGSVLNQKRLMENHNNAAAAQSFVGPDSSPSLANCNLRRFHYASSSSGDSPTKSSDTPHVISSRHSSIRQHSSDECSSNLSNSPRGSSTLDWETPTTYQRLSSCLSSNESGYDSDGRHVEEAGTSSVGLLDSVDSVQRIKKQMDSLSRRCSSASSSSVSAASVDATTIRRRFRQIKLNRVRQDDIVGVMMAPQYYHLNDVDMEVRYMIADIETNGLAYM